MLLSALERELPGLVASEGSGDWFVFYDPDAVTVPEKRFPVLTLVTGDRYDRPRTSTGTPTPTVST